MFEAFLPKKKIGVLSPLAVIDNSAYEFYQLVPRGIMMVTVPLGLQVPLLIGPAALQRLLDRIAEKTKLPVTSTVLDVVAATKRLGLEKIATANKLTEAMNQTLAQFFAKENISVVGASTQPMTPSEFVKMTSDASRVHDVILRRRPLEDSTVVGWHEKIVDQPTCGGIRQGRGSHDLLCGNSTVLCQDPSSPPAACLPGRLVG